MLLDDVRIQKSSSVALTTGGIGLMVGSLLLSFSALSVYRLNQAQDISVNLAPWSSLGDLRLGLEKGQEPLGPLLSEAVIPEKEFVGPTQPVYIAKAEAKPAPAVARKKKAVRHSWIARAKSAIKNVKQAVAKPAAPKFTPTIQAKPIQVVAETSAPSQASAGEMNTLRQLHQFLRGRFLMAMNTQPSAANVAVAQVAPQDKEAALAAEEPKVAEDILETARAAAVEVPPEPIEFKPLRKRERPHRIQKVLAEKLAEVTPAPVQVQPEVQKATVSEVAAQEPVVQEPENEVTTQPQVDQSPELAEAVQPKAQEDRITASQAAPDLEYSDAVDEPKTQVSEAQKPETSTSVDAVSPGILVSTGTQHTVLKATTGTQIAVTTQPRATQPAPKVDKQALAPSQPEPTLAAQVAMRTALTTEDHSDYSAEPLNTQAQAPLTEAFDWVSPVSGGETHYLAKETGEHHPGWIVAKAQDHWPTLTRKSNESIPLISTNASKLLSALAGTSLQGEAGILFGKVPSGWSVRLSGRSERPVFLNERNQSISQSNLEGERYFAFLNVAPGAHLLYLANRAGLEEGAVGVAVLGGTATYANLTQIRKTTLSGRVLDGSDAQVRALSGITVRVLGAINAHVETDRTGKFNLENILQVGDFPVYVETDAHSGYTHRYQLAPGKLQSILLYRLSETAIQTWINQLEGSISPDSGIIIGALPSLLSTVPSKAMAMPSVRSIAPSPTLRPEVYTLSPAGQMQVGLPMDTQSSRFVSVQVPEGPAIAHIADAQRNLIWSEMVMVSPAVVNIVGPY